MKKQVEDRFDFETHRDIVNTLAEQQIEEKLAEATEFSHGVYECFTQKFGRFATRGRSKCQRENS